MYERAANAERRRRASRLSMKALPRSYHRCHRISHHGCVKVEPPQPPPPQPRLAPLLRVVRRSRKQHHRKSHRRAAAAPPPPPPRRVRLRRSQKRSNGGVASASPCSAPTPSCQRDSSSRLSRRQHCRRHGRGRVAGHAPQLHHLLLLVLLRPLLLLVLGRRAARSSLRAPPRCTRQRLDGLSATIASTI